MSAKAQQILIAPEGMLGTAMSRGLGDHTAIGLPDMDITDAASVARGIPAGASVVINCAAYTDVDGAEEHEELAHEINARAVATLAARCAEVGALLVHFSTDYVFDGKATQPYRVDHPRDPVNSYGRSKAAGEQHLEASGADYLLIRTSWLYAPWAKNFVRTMAGLAATREKLRVVDDQRGRPTSAEHLARTTVALIEQGARGTFHATDGGECTWYEFATEIVARVNPACTVEPCTSAEFPRPAARPGYSVLDLSETEALIGAMASWQHNLADVLGRLPRG